MGGNDGVHKKLLAGNKTVGVFNPRLTSVSTSRPIRLNCHRANRDCCLLSPPQLLTDVRVDGDTVLYVLSGARSSAVAFSKKVIKRDNKQPTTQTLVTPLVASE